jgi:hypothetical protein
MRKRQSFIRSLIKHILDLVGGLCEGRVFPNFRPTKGEDAGLPAIVVTKIGRQRPLALKPSEHVCLTRIRVQIDIYAHQYEDAAEIEAAIVGHAGEPQLDGYQGRVDLHTVQCATVIDSKDSLVAPPAGQDRPFHRVMLDVVLWYEELNYGG